MTKNRTTELDGVGLKGSFKAVDVVLQGRRQWQQAGMALHVPADCAADGNAAEGLECARASGDCPDVMADLGAALSRLELFLDGRADAGHTGVQMASTQRRLKHVEDIERRPVVVARVDVEAARQVVADGVLARTAAERQLAHPEPVRVPASAHDAAQQAVEVLYEGGVEDRRVEDDDELFEVLAQHEASVETVSEEQAEHVVGETQQDVEPVGVVGGMVEPATERAEEESDGVVAERVDHVRIGAIATQHSNTRLHLVTQQSSTQAAVTAND